MRSTSSLSAVKQNDRHARALRAEIAAEIEARAVRQHHVEHDQVDVMRGELFAQLAAVCREQHAEALALDIAGEQLADFRIVVDDEDALGGCGHRSLQMVRSLDPF